MVTSDRDSTIKSKGIIWIPPAINASYKITIEKNGIEEEITDYAYDIEIEDGVTDIIGRFSIGIYNPDTIFTGKWNSMEIFRYYSDYAATATTKRFQGKIEKIDYQGYKIKISGRSEALKFMNITVTKNYADTEISQILRNIIDAYGDSGFTYTNVNNTVTSLTVNWVQKPFWECVQELCVASGYECYVDYNKDFHLFYSGSVENTNEGIVHEHNLIEIADSADDITLIKNRIIVYGAETDGIKEIAMAEDTDSQSVYGIREEIIEDSNVTTFTQAQEIADYKLSQSKDPKAIGEIKGILLATIQPGDKIILSSPDDNILPGLYMIKSYKHQIGGGKYYTIVNRNKEPRKFSHILKGNIESSYKSQNLSSNPEEMRYSYNFTFDTDSGTHTNTEITGGKLQIVSGYTTANWVSPMRTTSANVTEVYVKMVGSDLSNVQVQVSINNGISYENTIDKTKITLINPGTKLRIKVIFSSASANLDSLSVMYK